MELIEGDVLLYMLANPRRHPIKNVDKVIRNLLEGDWDAYIAYKLFEQEYEHSDHETYARRRVAERTTRLMVEGFEIEIEKERGC
jgi:hypothetical protein